MSEKTPARLDLEPGVAPRKASPPYRCLFWIRFLLGALVVGWILYLIALFFLTVAPTLRFPHRALYENTTLLNSQPGSVVRPLIDAQQTFDIAVSVWVRTTEEEEDKYRSNPKEVNSGTEGRQEKKGKYENTFVSAPMDTEDSKSWWGTVSTEELMRDDVILETPVYSDIAFRGLRLSEKGISTVINFRLPTARFRGINLTSQDLRASFVLIPSPPSPIDHLKNYSSWIPDSIKLLPRRAWPFPLGSPEQGNHTMADEALESFGISIPLIEIHPVQYRCSNSTSDRGDGKVEGASGTKVWDNDSGDNGSDEKEGDKANLDAEVRDSQRDKNDVTPGHMLHPHIVTRTQLHIVDETKLFNRKAYDKAHNALKASFCGQSFPNVRPKNSLCNRNYLRNGHWETRLQLEMPIAGSETETEVQWAYAPYLTTHIHGAGPMDFIAVPVSRENCSTSANYTEAPSEVAVLLPNPEDEEFIDITWRVSFSGHSAASLAFADMYNWPYRVMHNASEHEKMIVYGMAELANRFHGHWFHGDAHPRRRIFVIALSMAFSTLHDILDIHYWYSRVSTVSISISGTAFLGLSSVLGTLVDIPFHVDYITYSSNKLVDVFQLLLSIDLLVPFMMIKTITRTQFGWWQGTTWIPIVRRGVATHGERASMRLDARMSWRAKGGLYLSLVGIYYFFTPYDPPFYDFPEHKLLRLSEVLIPPLHLTGLVAQLLLNHWSRTFAGRYKLSVVVDLTLQAMFLANFVPAVLGRIDAPFGLSVVEAVVFSVLMVVIGWQALTLPSVPQTGEDGDEE